MKSLNIKKKYKSIHRVSCNHWSPWPPPKSNTAKTYVGRNVELPLLRDPRKHYHKQCFVSRWTCMLHAVIYMSLWHVDLGMFPCCLKLRPTASHRWNQRTAYPPSSDQHLCSREPHCPGCQRRPATHRENKSR
jgi:hypothetical protein